MCNFFNGFALFQRFLAQMYYYLSLDTHANQTILNASFRPPTTMTYANNIQPAVSPVTGMTVAEMAHWERYFATPEGKAEAAKFQAQWDALPEPTGWRVDAMELQYQSQQLSEIEARMAETDRKTNELLVSMGLPPIF
jgi:hypothetical protein